jgi:hypothetical protein
MIFRLTAAVCWGEADETDMIIYDDVIESSSKILAIVRARGFLKKYHKEHKDKPEYKISGTLEQHRGGKYYLVWQTDLSLRKNKKKFSPTPLIWLEGERINARRK